jgi:hypothetical protein
LGAGFLENPRAGIDAMTPRHAIASPFGLPRKAVLATHLLHATDHPFEHRLADPFTLGRSFATLANQVAGAQGFNGTYNHSAARTRFPNTSSKAIWFASHKSRIGYKSALKEAYGGGIVSPFCDTNTIETLA